MANKDFNADNINSVKGKIGELIFANYMYYKYRMDYSDPDRQEVGIDYQLIAIEGTPVPLLAQQTVDVKLSDKLGDTFSFFAQQDRHPNRFDNEADKLGVVQFAWDQYMKETHTSKKTYEELYIGLNKYIVQDLLDKLIDSIRKRKKGPPKTNEEIVLDLIALYKGHRTIDRLTEEYNNRKILSTISDFKDTLFLIEKYVTRIASIRLSPIQRIITSLEGLGNRGSFYDGDEFLASRKRVWLNGKPEYVVEISFSYLKNQTVMIYEREQKTELEQLDTQDLSFREKTIDFGCHKGSMIKQLSNEYLTWICTKAQKPGRLKEYYKLELDFRAQGKVNQE